MNRHRRRRIGLFVGRRTYMSLWHRYIELAAQYRILEEDHQSVLEDHEELLYDVEVPGPPEPEPEPARVRHAPSWAQTEPVPVITTVGLDPDKATALTRNTGLLNGPGGSWGVTRPENG